MEITQTTKWEYHIIKVPANKGLSGGKVDIETLNHTLNELGKERWELVASPTTQMGYGSSRDIIIIFKRPKLR